MGLTTKQESFCQLVAIQQYSLTDAYIEAYDTDGMQQNSIYQLSCRLSKQVKVTSRINELRDSVTSEMVANVAWTKERFIKEAEANLIQSRDLNQMNPANTSLQLIGRVTQILEDKPLNQVNIGIVETLGKLPDAVLQALESMGPSEPVPVISEAPGTIEASYKLLDEPEQAQE